MESRQDERLRKWCTDFSQLALKPTEKAEIDAITDEQTRIQRITDLLQPIIEPVWSFFNALCHALQEGENQLTAKDAYWLGLIDEVLGESDMSALRLIMEYKEDPKPTNQQPTTASKDQAAQNE